MRHRFGFRSVRTRPAMRTEFRANKDHAEAGRASDGGQARAAMFATRSVARSGGAAHGAVKGFSGHDVYDAWEPHGWQSGT